MKEPKFKTKTGLLTVYAFACGYVESFEHNNRRMTLSKDGVYHVMAFDHNKNERICWECFETLTEARKFYTKQKQKIKNNV